VTLDDVPYLLHLSIEGTLLDHDGPLSRFDAVDMMVQLLETDVDKAEEQVEKMNGAHARFS